MTLSHVTDGNALPAATINAWLDAINTNTSNVTALQGLGQVGAQTFTTDLASSGSIEVAGYSQSVALTSGASYRVWFKGLMSNSTSGAIGNVKVRYSTAALSTSSTVADTGQVRHGAGGGTGQVTLCFFADFTAPTTDTYNIGVSVFPTSATSSETIVGSTNATRITVHRMA